MNYLRIEEDGVLTVVEGSDPTTDQTLLAEIDDGTISVIRYAGNTFQLLNLEEIESESESEDDEEADTVWSGFWEDIK